MDSINLSLEQKLKTSLKLSPKLLYGQNLLFTPVDELASECGRLLGDNPFFSFRPPRRLISAEEIDSPNCENLEAQPTLEEHLLWQITTCPGYDSVKIRTGADFWISLLGTDGYLNTSASEISQISGLPRPVSDAFLTSLKNYVEPAGLFAEGLAESLLVQLARSENCSHDAEELLTCGKDYLLAGKLAEYAEIKGWDKMRTDKAMSALRSLDPAPGKNFAKTGCIVPEIEFRIDGNEVKPKLLLDNLPKFACELDEMLLSPSELIASKWLSPSWSQAKLIITRLGLRYRTILRISILIADKQRDRIISPEASILPLTYREAASALGLSVSTVFRAVKNSWVKIGAMTVRMDSFFGRGLNSKREMSVAEAENIIFEMNRSGCSDKEISLKLQMPARTVTYHRNKLGLSPVSKKH